MNDTIDRKVRTAGFLLITFVALVVVMAAAAAPVLAGAKKCTDRSTKAWSFGVMGDTQWTCSSDPTGANPNGVPVSIIKQINQQFIDKGVKFVIQVGDLTETGTDAAEDTRAAAAQQLYKAGIGYFPMRGNHETYSCSDTGVANDYAIPEFRKEYPQTRGLSNTFGAKNFSSPVTVSSDLSGMSYSFDYGAKGDNARFVILDNWVTPSKDVSAAGYDYGYSFGDQQSWISSRLNENTRGTTQAFVFSHQPLIAENHQDSPFVGYTNADLDVQNAFIASLQDNDVAYYICGHDHVDQRSAIASPDGASSVQEIICASDSSKFYTPKSLTDAKWYGQKTRETSISQDLYRVGYYIYTVDGPRVTVDYYADTTGGWMSDASYPAGPTGAGSMVTPTFTFAKRASWGYSLNGKQFLVGGSNDASYTAVKDSHDGTCARILGGSYGNTATDYNARVLTQSVNTGWTDDDRRDRLDSDVLTLWGMTPVGASQTATYTLAMSVKKCDAFSGAGVVMARDDDGDWVKAVSLNAGDSTATFVRGPWKSTYGLGTYGYDPNTRTAWAVINHDGSFAVDGGRCWQTFCSNHR